MAQYGLPPTPSWPPQPGPPQPQDMMQQQPPVQMPTGPPMPQQVSTLTPQGQVGFEALQGPQPGGPQQPMPFSTGQPPQQDISQQQGGMYQDPMDGMVPPIPPPSRLGFWETIRQAAQNDPSYFYSVLADVARLNPEGIQQTMQRREDVQWRERAMQGEMAMKRQAIALESARDKRELGQQRQTGDIYYVRAVRQRLAAEGVLGEAEQMLGGPLTTAEQAEQAETFLGQQVAARKSNAEKLKVLQALARNPAMKLVGKAAGWYSEDEQFRASADSITANAERTRADKDEERKQRMQARSLAMQHINQVIRDAKVDPATRMRVTDIAKRREDVDQDISRISDFLDEWKFAGSFMDANMKMEYDNSVRELERLQREYDDYSSQIEQLISSIQSPGTPPPSQGGAPPSPATGRPPVPNLGANVPDEGTAAQGLSLDDVDEYQRRKRELAAKLAKGK